MKTRKCNNCESIKSYSEFPKHSRMKDGIYSDCKLCHSLKVRKRYFTDKNYRNHVLHYQKIYSKGHRFENNAYGRRYNRKLRLETLQAYGGKCNCCGEKKIEFLTFDHIRNNGAEHRRSYGGHKTNRRIFQVLRMQNFPKGEYQVLCYNCNYSKGHHGYCPHKDVA